MDWTNTETDAEPGEFEGNHFPLQFSCPVLPGRQLRQRSRMVQTGTKEASATQLNQTHKEGAEFITHFTCYITKQINTPVFSLRGNGPSYDDHRCRHVNIYIQSSPANPQSHPVSFLFLNNLNILASLSSFLFLLTPGISWKLFQWATFKCAKHNLRTK
jgi:hypothetical protein